MRRADGHMDSPRALTPSGVLNILSFFATLPTLPLVEKSCHLFLPASNSLFALTFLGTFAGRIGPSLTLLGSLFAWLASVGSMLAAAEITPEFMGALGSDGVAGLPSAFLFLSLEMGLRSCAERVSVTVYPLNVTMYIGLLDDPVIEVILAG